MIDADEAYRIFKPIRRSGPITHASVYWDALDAERDGKITIAEMDAIAVYHTDEIVLRGEIDPFPEAV